VKVAGGLEPGDLGAAPALSARRHGKGGNAHGVADSIDGSFIKPPAYGRAGQ
jgi:hypothetical protein